MGVKDLLVWFSRVVIVATPISVMATFARYDILQEWYWKILQWFAVWAGISIYIKLGGD